INLEPPASSRRVIWRRPCRSTPRAQPWQGSSTRPSTRAAASCWSIWNGSHTRAGSAAREGSATGARSRGSGLTEALPASETLDGYPDADSGDDAGRALTLGLLAVVDDGAAGE